MKPVRWLLVAVCRTGFTRAVPDARRLQLKPAAEAYIPTANKKPEIVQTTANFLLSVGKLNRVPASAGGPPYVLAG